MMYKEQIEFYKKNGYVVLRDRLNIHVLREIRKDIAKVFSTQCQQLGICLDSNRLFNLFQKHPEVLKNCGKTIQSLVSVHNLMLSPDILEEVKELISFPQIATKPVLFFHNKKLAEQEIYYKTPPHQDAASIQGSINGVVAWIPLVDCTYDGIGPLQVVPGSHLKGAQWSKFNNSFGLVEGYEDKDFETVYMFPKDLLLFSSFLVHRSGNNTTDRIRYSANFRYNDLNSEEFIERGYPNPYYYKSVVENDTWRPTSEEMEAVYGKNS